MNGSDVARTTRPVQATRRARRTNVLSPHGQARPSDMRRYIMRTERVRLQPYVDAPLAKQLAVYGAATGMTTSSVAQPALRQYLDRTDEKILLFRRINQRGRAWNRPQRALETNMDAFAINEKVWFPHIPQTPDKAKGSARREAESR